MKSEVKASLEKVKELEAQLQLEQKKNEELQKELKVQLELKEKKNEELQSEKNNTAWFQFELYSWVVLHIQEHGLPFPSIRFSPNLAFEVEKWGGTTVMVFSRPRIRIKQSNIIVCSQKYYDDGGLLKMLLLPQRLLQTEAKCSALAFVLEVPALS